MEAGICRNDEYFDDAISKTFRHVKKFMYLGSTVTKN